jgi:hypothetical protein
MTEFLSPIFSSRQRYCETKLIRHLSTFSIRHLSHQWRPEAAAIQATSLMRSGSGTHAGPSPGTCCEADCSIANPIKVVELISYCSRQRRTGRQHDAQQMSVEFAARLHLYHTTKFSSLVLIMYSSSVQGIAVETDPNFLSTSL